MNPKIKTLAQSILKEPTEVNISIAKPADKIIQAAYLVNDDEKVKLLKHLLHDMKWRLVSFRQFYETPNHQL